LVLHASLHDTFGDHGVIFFSLIEKNEDVWNIKYLLMSCRVFGRGVEDAFLSYLIQKAHKEGVTKITIESEETEKNVPAREFIQKHFINNERGADLPLNAPEWVTLQIYENI
jgi:FkbH-like protein